MLYYQIFVRQKFGFKLKVINAANIILFFVYLQCIINKKNHGTIGRKKMVQA